MRRVFFVLVTLIAATALGQSADQEIVSITDSPDPVTPGSNTTYTITFRNNGPDAATNGGVNILLDGNLIPVSATPPAGFNCTALSQIMTCNTPSFGAGVTATVTLVLQMAPSLVNFPDGSTNSNFTTSGTTPDPNNSNNAQSESTSWDSPQIDIALTVTDSPDPVFPDGNITYSITLSNNGPDTATNVNFNVPMNNTLKYVSHSVPAQFTNCVGVPPVGGTSSFTCTAPMLAPGTYNLTVVLEADSAAFGIIDQTIQQNFNANGTGDDTNDNNSSETESTQYVTPDANLGVSVTDSPDPVFPDGNITYTVNVTNAGPDAATNATLSIFNNGSLRFQSITEPSGWNCTEPAVGSAPVFSCTNPSFANGGNVTFTLVVQADDAILGNADGTVSTNFTVTSAVADPVSTNNSETEDTAYVTPDAELAITNADAPDPVAPGGTITYTQVVTNNGPDTPSLTTVSQTLPASVGFVSINNTGGFTCATPAVGASGAINCTHASFGNGATSTFTLVVTVLASSGTVGNTVTVSSPLQDPIAPNNSASVMTTILAVATADLAITKATTADNVAAGASLAYTITLTNNGPDAATNVVVTDVLAAELLFRAITAPAGFSCTTPAVGANGTITCTAASMASGATASFTLVVQTTANAVGPINNTATAASSTNDGNSGNNNGVAAPVAVGGAGTADLSITKTTPTTTAGSGDTITYTITISNAGPNAANDVIVTDTLPSTLLFQSITPAASFTCATPAAGSSGTIICTGGPLASGANAVFTLVVTIAQNATGSVTNSGAVASSDADPNAGNSSSTSPGVIVATADLSIMKSTAATSAPTGSTVSYTITVTNNGPDTATSVVVSDDLPPGLQFVSATPTQGSCTTGDPFTCTVGTLANGASATITLQALVTATSGTVANSATVTAATDDNNPGNNGSTSAPVPVVPNAPGGDVDIPTLSEWAVLLMIAVLCVVGALKMR